MARVRFGRPVLDATRKSDGVTFAITQDGHEFLVYRAVRLVKRVRTLMEALAILGSHGCAVDREALRRVMPDAAHEHAYVPRNSDLARMDVILQTRLGNSVDADGKRRVVGRNSVGSMREKDSVRTARPESGRWAVEGGRVRKVVPVENGRILPAVVGGDPSDYKRGAFDGDKRQRPVKGALSVGDETVLAEVESKGDGPYAVKTLKLEDKPTSVPLADYAHQTRYTQERTDGRKPARIPTCTVVNGVHEVCHCA